MQPDRLSSHPAQTSQPAPLSHSLLSQLELSEHDPNTYRDIIDDLTVQNQKLRRRLKRYEKDYSIATSQDGLFEVRVRRLPPGKRRELERILQDFLSTVPSSRERSNARSDDLRARASLRRQEPKIAPKPIQSPSPNMKGLDSAYSSISATGVTASAVEDRSNTELTKQATSDLGRVMLSDLDRVPQSNGDYDVSDVAKQKVVVARLEMLFSGREPVEGDMYGPNMQIESLKRDGPTALATGEPSTTFAEEYPPAASKTTNSVDFGNPAQPTDRPSDFPAALSQQPLIGPDLPNANVSRASLDHWHHLRHLGAASPLAGSSPQSSHGWVYLNVLFNMAQLHTLNVTLDFVRQAIHDISENLMLSEDGRKVRWCEERLKNHAEPLPEANDVIMSVSSPQPSPPSKSKQTGDANQSAAKDQRPHLPTTVAHKTSSYKRRRQLQAREFDYKPMFLHTKDRLRQYKNSQQEYQDSSYESDTSSSSSSTTSEELSGLSRGGSKRSNDRRGGPMVFFDHDPFFLDLSADPPVNDEANGHASYDDPDAKAEPLGSHLPPATESSRIFEKKREWGPSAISPRASDEEQSGPSSSSSPPLEIYGNDPSDEEEEEEEKAQLHHNHHHHLLEASGIGGIQLDDNLVIDVRTAQDAISPSPPASSLSSRTTRQAPTKRSHIPSHLPTLSQKRYRSTILSRKLAHLTPSPLPPPSFVYPALTDSEDEDAAEGALDDIRGFEDGGGEEEGEGLEFCPVVWARQGGDVGGGEGDGEGDGDAEMDG